MILFSGCQDSVNHEVVEGTTSAGDLIFALREPQFSEADSGMFTTPCILLAKNIGSTQVEILLPNQHYNILTPGMASAARGSLEETRLQVSPGGILELPLGTIGSQSPSDRIDIQFVVNLDGTLNVVTTSSIFQEVIGVGISEE